MEKTWHAPRTAGGVKYGVAQDQHGLTANMIVEIAREFAREIATCCKLLPLTVGAWMG